MSDNRKNSGNSSELAQSSATRFQLASLYVPLVFSVVGLVAIYYDPANRLFVAGVGISLIFGFTLSTLARFIETSKTFKDAIEGSASALSEVRNELNEIKSHNLLNHSMADARRVTNTKSLVEGLQKIEEIAVANPSITNFCEWKIAQIENLVRDVLKQADNGQVVIDDPARELTSSLELLRSACSHEVLAVSFEDTPFWTSPEGARFLKEHEIAIARGVSITRVFIVESEDETDLIPVMKIQSDLGVKVLKVAAASVADLSPSDVVVYDNRLLRMGYNKEFTKNNMFKSAQLVVAPEVVNKQRQIIEAIIARAEEI